MTPDIYMIGLIILFFGVYVGFLYTVSEKPSKSISKTKFDRKVKKESEAFYRFKEVAFFNTSNND